MTDPRLAYALARLGARHADVGRGAERAALSASRGAERYLEVLRQTRLLAPPESVTARDVDAFELYLAGAWRAACEELARWHPPRWRPAYRWCAVLVDLPVLESLRGPAVPGRWALGDPRLAPLASAGDVERPRAFAAAGLAPLVAAYGSGAPLAPAWRAHWRALWPHPARAVASRLTALESLLEGAARAPGPLAERRAGLAARLERCYRRSQGTPAAGFCELARRALDLETWRGGFAARLYRPAAPGVAP